jgi:uncharacterized membrane protein
MSLAPLAAEPLITQLHTVAALVAALLLVPQAVVVRGSFPHRMIGRVWVGLMVFVALSSFWIHELRLWGPFSPIHLLAVLMLVSLPLGVMAARAGNIRRHRTIMLALAGSMVLTGLFTLLPGRTMYQVVFG